MHVRLQRVSLVRAGPHHAPGSSDHVSFEMGTREGLNKGITVPYVQLGDRMGFCTFAGTTPRARASLPRRRADDRHLRVPVRAQAGWGRDTDLSGAAETAPASPRVCDSCRSRIGAGFAPAQPLRSISYRRPRRLSGAQALGEIRGACSPPAAAIPRPTCRWSSVSRPGEATRSVRSDRRSSSTADGPPPT